jgi:nitronate monooxygenase
VFDLSELPAPIVQAPMAGGPSTSALAIAVCEAGALGFLAAGYKTAEAVAEEIDAVRAGTDRPFGVNLFMPSAAPASAVAVNAYLHELALEAARYGVALGEPRFDDDDFEHKLALVCEQRVPVVSFTFGCPVPSQVERIHAAGGAVWVTVTNVAEGAEAQRAGADALVVQGIEAGGHRGGFSDDERAPGSGLLALVRLLSSATALPLVATGAIADGPALAAVLAAGAAAGQVGTALMLAPEAGTPPAQRDVLARPGATRLTRAFTGRLARGIVNRFMEEHDAGAPAAYPEIHHATSPLRARARSAGDAGGFNLWAGEAHELARPLPAAETIAQLATGAREALRRAATRLDRP